MLYTIVYVYNSYSLFYILYWFLKIVNFLLPVSQVFSILQSVRITKLHLANWSTYLHACYIICGNVKETYRPSGCKCTLKKKSKKLGILEWKKFKIYPRLCQYKWFLWKYWLINAHSKFNIDFYNKLHR